MAQDLCLECLVLAQQQVDGCQVVTNVSLHHNMINITFTVAKKFIEFF